MKDEIAKYIQQFTSIEKDRLYEIVDQLSIISYKRGTIFVEQGDIAIKCYFVLKGCIRKYFCSEDGKEITVDFYTENQTAAIYDSYANKTPSNYALSCVEDCILIVGDSETENAMYEKYTGLKDINFSIMEQNLGKAQEYMAAFVSSSPEERYRSLLKNRSDLIERVPQHQLASYLGITPESLSRIRKRISNSTD